MIRARRALERCVVRLMRLGLSREDALRGALGARKALVGRLGA